MNQVDCAHSQGKPSVAGQDTSLTDLRPNTIQALIMLLWKWSGIVNSSTAHLAASFQTRNGLLVLGPEATVFSLAINRPETNLLLQMSRRS